MNISTNNRESKQHRSAHRLTPEVRISGEQFSNGSDHTNYSLQIGPDRSPVPTVATITPSPQQRLLRFTALLCLLYLQAIHITILLLSMDDPSLQPININILHNHTPHSPVKSSLRTTFRGETTSIQNNGKRVTFPSEGIHSSEYGS